MSKFIKVLIIFTLVLAAVGYGFWRSNIYSKEELKLEMIGPSAAQLGQEVEYVVKYKNNGQFRLENPSLIFQAPDFSIKDDKIYTQEVIDADKLGGAIYPGEERSISFKMRLVGKAGDAKVAKAALSYQPKNLSARYDSNTTYTTVMKDVPIDFDMDLSSTVEANKNFHFKINYLSNVDWLLTDLRINVDYPEGYAFSEATPKSLDKNEWTIPVLNKNQSGIIDVTGQLTGNLGDGKVFRARIGMWKDGQYLLLKEIEKGTKIVKPTVSIRQTINGDSNYIAKPGDWLHYEIYYKNISDSELYNLVMVDKLDGDLFDFSSIKSDTGSYQGGDSSIVFDWKQNDKLAYLTTMDEGKAEFWVKLKDDLSHLSQPELNNRVMIGVAREDFSTKISSKLELVQKVFYNDEIFGNSGPNPARVGSATTYTITWQAKNYYSDVKGVTAQAVLPDGVAFNSDKVFPEAQVGKLVYDNTARTLTWNIGDMTAGQGMISNPLNVSFQVTLVAVDSQAGGKAGIMGQISIKGDDSWTDSTLESTVPAIDTGSLSDAGMTPEQGNIQTR